MRKSALFTISILRNALPVAFFDWWNSPWLSWQRMRSGSSLIHVYYYAIHDDVGECHDTEQESRRLRCLLNWYIRLASDTKTDWLPFLQWPCTESSAVAQLWAVNLAKAGCRPVSTRITNKCKSYLIFPNSRRRVSETPWAGKDELNVTVLHIWKIPSDKKTLWHPQNNSCTMSSAKLWETNQCVILEMVMPLQDRAKSKRRMLRSHRNQFRFRWTLKSYTAITNSHRGRYVNAFKHFPAVQATINTRCMWKAGAWSILFF